MKSPEPIDAGRLTLALSDLRLPAIKTIWPDLAARADKEGWPRASWRRSPSTRWPSAPAGASSAISTRRGFRPASPRQLRLRGGADDQQGPGDGACAGDSWLEKAANLLMFGPPGGGKSHLAAASAWLWWRTAGGCCSPARRIWCRSSRAPGGPAAGAGDCQTRQIPPADPG